MSARWLLILPLLAGCNAGPSRVEAPSIDAASAGAAAIEMYDKDADGAIKGAELDAVPSFKAALARIDANKDGGVTAEEITARIESWQKFRTGLVGFGVLVNLDKVPLQVAQIRYEPEPFLGDALKTAICETNAYGRGSPTVPKAERANADDPDGIPYGFYKVKITRDRAGKNIVPAQYNEATTLGHEVAPDDPAVLNLGTQFDLKSK